MAFAIEWDKDGERYFEAGTDRGVLYQIDSTTGNYVDGEAWNGLTAVNSNPGGAEANELWADNMKYAVLRSAETYGGTIECYTYPDGFKQNNGEANLIENVPGIVASGQSRKAFGFSYRTKVGNDVDGLDHAYKIHLVYKATASPSEKAYQTINDSPDGITMSYEFETTPVGGTGPIAQGGDGLAKPTAHIEIDTTQFTDAGGQAFIAALEACLYGVAGTENPISGVTGGAAMPSPRQLIDLYNRSNF